MLLMRGWSYLVLFVEKGRFFTFVGRGIVYSDSLYMYMLHSFCFSLFLLYILIHFSFHASTFSVLILWLAPSFFFNVGSLHFLGFCGELSETLELNNFCFAPKVRIKSNWRRRIMFFFSFLLFWFLSLFLLW